MLEKDAMDILMKFLDRKVREAEEEITQKGTLSDDKAIPLILKTQFNHISHLEDEISEIRQAMDRRFGQVNRNMMAGFAFLSFLMTVLRFIR